ncbi:MAG: hypothetical protein KJT01_10025 [Gemmatimonadetes bacterium]|nr:hypothetical protein [Gemmatimonadota bacterium]
MHRLRALAPLLMTLLLWQAGWGASVAACQMLPTAPGSASVSGAAHAGHAGHAGHGGYTPPRAAAPHDPAATAPGRGSPASSDTPTPPCPLPGGCATTGPVPAAPTVQTAAALPVTRVVPRAPQHAPAAPTRAPEPPPPRIALPT